MDGLAVLEDHACFGGVQGFHPDADAAPYATHWRTESYLTQELPQVPARHFGARLHGGGIFGHSMGGHGALTLALRPPSLYRSVSALVAAADAAAQGLTPQLLLRCKLRRRSPGPPWRCAEVRLNNNFVEASISRYNARVRCGTRYCANPV